MLEGIEQIFDEMQKMMKKLKKKSYETNMNAFREKHGHYFTEMTDYVEKAQDKKKAAEEIAKTFVEKTGKHYAKGGRINGRVQADLNFFMIYYTFPAILLTGSGDAVLVADSIRDVWAENFKESNIKYADYDTIYGGFREKILGIF